MLDAVGPPPGTCPPRGVLLAFLGGDLDDFEASRVRDHVDECPSCSSTLDAADDDPDLRGLRTLAATDPDATAYPGDDDDRYRPVRALGAGSFGEVSVAYDGQFHRHVALKEIQGGYTDAEARALAARFEREALITGGLEHPGIVPVYSLSRDSRGRPFYAMRLVRGDSLAKAIAAFHAEGPAGRRDATARTLMFRDLLRRFIDACQAVDYAHSRRVIHRDIKPDHILLGPFGETVVVDWGLAKVLDTPDGDHAEAPADGPPPLPQGDAAIQTAQGRRVGTEGYMSPEAARGDLKNLGPASDIYSLGAVLIDILRGPRGAAGNPEAGPPALAAIARKTTAPLLEDRYPTAGALARDVELWLADEPVSAHRDPWAARAGRWVRKHRTLAGIAAVTALLSAVVLLAWARFERRNVLRLAAEQRQTERWLSEAMTSYEDYYSGLNEEALRGGVLPPDVVKMLLQKPRQFYGQLARDLSDKPMPTVLELSLLARSRANLGRILRILGRRGEALDEATGSVELYDQLARSRPGDLDLAVNRGRALLNLGVILHDLGRDRECHAAYRRAVDALESTTKLDYGSTDARAGLAEALVLLGSSILDLGQAEEAAAAYGRAFDAFDALAAEHPEEAQYRQGSADASDALGLALRRLGRPDRAAAAHRRAAEAFEALAAGNSSDVRSLKGLGYVLSNLGVVLRDLGELDEACEAYTRAIGAFGELTRREAAVLEHRDQLGRAHDNLGLTLRDLGRLDEARAAYEAAAGHFGALAAANEDAPGYRASLARTLSNLAAVLSDAMQAGPALDAAARSVDAYERLVRMRPDHPDQLEDLARAVGNYGVALQMNGGPREALAAYERSVAEYGSLASRFPDVPDYLMGEARGLGNLGLRLDDEGREREAADAHRRAIAIYELLRLRWRDLPDYRDGLGYSWANLGAALGGLNRFEEAAEAYGKAVHLYEGLASDYPGNPLYRGQLAQNQGVLGKVLDALGRHEEARGAHGRAVEGLRGLSAAEPDLPGLKSDLAIALSDLGDSLAFARLPAEAITPYREAIELQKAAHRLSPLDPVYRVRLGRHYGGLAVALEAIGRDDEASRALDDRVAICGDSAEEAYNTACYAAACVAVAPNALVAPRRAALAIRALRPHVEEGSIDGFSLAGEPQFGPLESFAGFRRLRDEALDRGFPRDPFPAAP